MRINNKGFMLIEVIVTSTVVLTSMLVLYSSFSKLYNNFKVKNAYYDADGVYVAEELVKRIIEVDSGDEENNFNINKYLLNLGGKADNTALTVADTALIRDKKCERLSASQEKTDEVCEKIKDLYNVRSVFLLEYSAAKLKEAKKDAILDTQTFKEYIDYLLKYYADDFDDDKYSYIVLVEYGNDNNYKYANLRLR